MEKLAGSWRVAWGGREAGDGDSWEGRRLYLPFRPSLRPSSSSVHVHETPPERSIGGSFRLAAAKLFPAGLWDDGSAAHQPVSHFS
ncbi:hypothetical protein E2C01_019219 [Portunus trituberculatus]|uniref:Uncharacterized protein n=1 Tax=Portunus trituberculatus TaxID=210409 RepID=A0A5B7DXA5_PORTR|nr:hypothetical protein [Portunus trituberculatus]